MPVKPAEYCRAPGCPEMAVKGVYCERHNRERQRQRRSECKKKYDTRWQKIRAHVLLHNPVCNGYVIEEEGIWHKVPCGRPATEVHHIIALDDGGTHAEENLVALCKKHHSQVTRHAERGKKIEFKGRAG